MTTRALVTASVVVVLAIVVVCATVVLDTRRDVARQADQGADNIAAAMAQDIARNIELYDISLQAVVRGLQFPGFATLDPGLRQMILFDRSPAARHLGFINVLNAAGEVTADSRSKIPRSGNFGGRDYFQFHRREPQDQLYIGRPFLTGPDQPATIPLSRRLSEPDGGFAGVVVGTIRLAYFHELFARVALGPHATIALLRDDGLVLMRMPFSQDDLGRTVAAGSPYFASLAAGLARIEGGEPNDPTRRSYTFKRVADLPLVVGVGLADEDIYTPWRHKAIATLATVAVLCLLLVMAIAGLGVALTRQARAEAKAVQAAQEMERFVEVISHELRTPLTGILGYAELLAWDKHLPPDLGGFAAAITSAGTHMSHVIKRMLKVPRPSALFDPPDPQDTDLDRLVEDCLKEVEPSAARFGLRLACTVAPDLPRSAVLDPSQVHQILVNLLVNAIKYTAKGSVELRLSRAGGALRFEVADTGPGIPAGKQARLFVAYDRLDAEQGHIEGTGLGLWTVQSLVTGMGGRVGYAANPGGGSIFWVELPATATAPTTPPPVASDVRSAPGALRVLLVDDTAMNRDLANRFLSSAGHTVVEACDGAQAVQQAAEADFDVVLMDIRMPGMNGLEASRRIRGVEGPRGRVPIVAVTANCLPADDDTYRKAGIDQHLLKPYTCDELLRMVDTIAAGRTRPPLAVTSTSQPVASDRPLPVLDLEVLEQLSSRMSVDNIEAYLRTFLGRIDNLLVLLRTPTGDTLAELVHEMQGGAGFLGFTALGAALHRYDAVEPQAAEEKRSHAAELLSVTERSRAALCLRLTALGLDTVGADDAS